MIDKQRQTFNAQALELVALGPLWLSFIIRAFTPIRDSGFLVARLPNRAAGVYVEAQGGRLRTGGFGQDTQIRPLKPSKINGRRWASNPRWTQTVPAATAITLRFLA